MEECFHLQELRKCSGVGLSASGFVNSLLKDLDLPWICLDLTKARKKRKKFVVA